MMANTREQCIFCSIIRKEIPARIILEDETVLAIADIVPQAPIHYLIIPKKHIIDVRDLTSDDTTIASNLLMAARQLSVLHNNASCKLVMNNGHEAGQRVFHMHLHFLSGDLGHTSMLV